MDVQDEIERLFGLLYKEAEGSLAYQRLFTKIRSLQSREAYVYEQRMREELDQEDRKMREIEAKFQALLPPPAVQELYRREILSMERRAEEAEHQGEALEAEFLRLLKARQEILQRCSLKSDFQTSEEWKDLVVRTRKVALLLWETRKRRINPRLWG